MSPRMSAEPFLRAILRLYPPDFRRRYGTAIAEFHRERLRGARDAGESRFVVWIRIVADAVVSALAERLRAARAARAERAPRPRLTGDPIVRLMLRDAKFALRDLVRRPAFTAVVLATLALGVGANAAIFSVVNGVLLRPLPYPHAERVVHFGHEPPAWLAADQDFLDYHRDVRAFERLAAYTRRGGHAHGRWRSGARALRARHRGLLPGVRRRAAARPRVRARRARGRHAHGGDHQPRALAAALRRRALRHRPHDPRERRRAHRRRRDAAALRLPGGAHRRLGAHAAHPAGQPGQARAHEPLPVHGRPSARRRHAATGDDRGDRRRAARHARRAAALRPEEPAAAAHDPRARGAGRHDAAVPARAARRGGLRAAHRVRERRQPAARARRVAAQGARAPQRARRVGGAARRAAPHGEPGARGARRRARRGARGGARARAARRGARRHPARRRRSASTGAWGCSR